MRGQSYSNKKNNSNKEDFQGGETKVMKKSLKMLLVFALVFSMFAPAIGFAAEAEMDAQAKFDAMVEAGILEGIDGEAALDKNMQRNEVAKILANIFELEVVAGAPTPFPDEPADNWGYTDGYIQAVVAAGLMQGGSKEDGTIGFRPNDQLSLQELAVVLNRALDLPAGDEVEGKTSSWATDAVAAVVAAGLLPASDDFTVEATRGDLVSSTYEVYVAYEASKVPDVLALASFEAAGAKKLTVEFNKAVDAAELTFKRGNITLTGDVTWNDAKTVATFENVTRLVTADNYSVTATVGEEEFTATASVTASKVASIEILGENLILNATDAKLASIGYKVLNQYGEAVTNSSESNGTSFNSSRGTATSNASNGTITVTTATYMQKDDVVVVSVVHAGTGITASKALKVSDAANIASFDFGGVNYPADVEKIYVDGSNLTNKFYFDFAAQDQYGNNITNQSQLTAGVEVVTSNSNIAGYTWSTNSSSEATLEIVPGTISGTAVFTAIIKATGQTSQFTVEVLGAASPKSVLLEVPATDIKKDGSVYIPYTVEDQYGTKVTKYDDLVSNTVLNLSTAGSGYTIAKEKNPLDGTLRIKLSAASNAANSVVVTATVGTTISQITINSVDAAAVTSVKGLKDTAPSVHFVKSTGSPNSVLTSGNFTIHDQYGSAIALDATDRLVVSSTGSAVTLTGTSPVTGGFVLDDAAAQSVTLTGTDTAGNTTLTVKLQKFDGANWNDTDSVVRITTATVAKSDLVDYSASVVGTVYGHTSASSDYEVNLSPHGLTADGTKVKLTTSDYTLSSLNTTNLSVTGTTVKGQGLATGAYDVQVGLVTTFAGATAPITKSQTVTVSAKAPVAESIAVAGSAVDTGVAVVSTVDTLNLTTSALVKFVVTDSYGVETVLTPAQYIVTNVTDGKVASVSGHVISSNVIVGESFIVTAITANGKTASVKIIKGN